MEKKEHLPIFGIGPWLIVGLALTAAITIVIFCYVCRIGTVSGLPALLMQIIGVVLIAAGIMIWFTGAVRSDMDDHIKENRLKTDGIYAWVRNPMYSGWWMMITGISLMWHNLWLIPVFFVNWGIMTAVLRSTEEKWLRDLYGQEYEDYCKRVNRCIPLKRK